MVRGDGRAPRARGRRRDALGFGREGSGSGSEERDLGRARTAWPDRRSRRGGETAGRSGVLVMRGSASVRLEGVRSLGGKSSGPKGPKKSDGVRKGKAPGGVIEASACSRVASAASTATRAVDLAAGLCGQWVLLKPGAGGAAFNTDLPKGRGGNSEKEVMLGNYEYSERSDSEHRYPFGFLLTVRLFFFFFFFLCTSF